MKAAIDPSAGPSVLKIHDGMGNYPVAEDPSRSGPQLAVALPPEREDSLQETLLAHERLARDLKIAEQVQRQLLPQSLPEVSGYEFFAYYHAACEVGGDYYDFVPLPDNRLGIALGDVSGKGVAAALLMAKFSGDTRLHLQIDVRRRPPPAR